MFNIGHNTTNQIRGIWWYPDLRECVWKMTQLLIAVWVQVSSKLSVNSIFFCYTWPRTYPARYQCFRYPYNTLLIGDQFHKIPYLTYTMMGTSHTYLGRFYIFHSIFSSSFSSKGFHRLRVLFHHLPLT